MNIENIFNHKNCLYCNNVLNITYNSNDVDESDEDLNSEHEDSITNSLCNFIDDLCDDLGIEENLEEENEKYSTIKYECSSCKETFTYDKDIDKINFGFSLFNLKIHYNDNLKKYNVLVDYQKSNFSQIEELIYNDGLLTVDEFDLDFSDKEKLYNKFKTYIIFS